MKCCLDCRKLEAEPRRGISAAADKSNLLLWGWRLWSDCAPTVGPEGEAGPCCRTSKAGFAEPASSQLATKLLLVLLLPLTWLLLGSHPAPGNSTLFQYLQPKLQASIASRLNLPHVGEKKTSHSENCHGRDLQTTGLAVSCSLSQPGSMPAAMGLVRQ